MISENQPYSIEDGEFRHFIFLCETIDELDNAQETHLFVFDHTGGCYESHYFYPKARLARDLERLAKNDITVWELIPHGEPSLPAARYMPAVRDESRPEYQPPIQFDKLYAHEVLRKHQN